MMHLVPIFAIIGFFASVITYFYMKYKSSHTEKMALIESGQSADLLSEKKHSNSESSLKNGLFLIGGGLGFVAGRILESIRSWGEGSDSIACALIGAGIGLVIFYQMMSKKES